MTDLPPCCCADWISGLARDHASRLAAIARREGLGGGRRARCRPRRVSHAARTAGSRGASRSPGRCRERARRDREATPRATLAAATHRAKPHVPSTTIWSSELAPPDAHLERAETSAQLAGCMADLGDIHRSVVTLRILEELSGDEAARRARAHAESCSACCYIARASSSSSACCGQADRTSPLAAAVAGMVPGHGCLRADIFRTMPSCVVGSPMAGPLDGEHDPLVLRARIGDRMLVLVGRPRSEAPSAYRADVRDRQGPGADRRDPRDDDGGDDGLGRHH